MVVPAQRMLPVGQHLLAVGGRPDRFLRASLGAEARGPLEAGRDGAPEDATSPLEGWRSPGAPPRRDGGAPDGWPAAAPGRRPKRAGRGAPRSRCYAGSSGRSGAAGSTKSRCSSIALVKLASTAKQCPPPRTGEGSSGPSTTLPRPAAGSRVSTSRRFSTSSNRAHGASISSPSASASGPSLAKPKERTLTRPEEALPPERFQLGFGGEIISDWGAISFRNRGRFEVGMVSGLRRNQHRASSESP
jgi:hypothetical protein